ncbi:hypothetical protein GIW45_04120 [Pseudomonas congelans]|uniref:hypothetical protein n=1 Tax=Pseudomonas congelans TaxID=200452 RepID=UPI001F406224|nr:hypothetical protein [Pseudomonas congelans]MCF5163303.1 hypothetical protein [Pseudomonas congelans]
MFEFRKLESKLKAMSWSGRFYGFSIVVVVLGMLLSVLMGFAILNIAILLASLGFVVGFMFACLRIYRWFISVWDKPFGKTPVILLHLLVLLISTVISRQVVAEALGLPPQSFDITVGFLVLVFYIPAWLLLGSIVFTLLGFLLLIGVMLGSLLLIPLSFIASLLNVFSLRSYLRRAWSKVVPAGLSFTNVQGHSVGALLSGVILINLYGALVSDTRPWVYSSVRLIAVLSDFQPAANYPGVQAGEYAHPLDNGFVAIAKELADKSIEIEVKKQIEDFEHPQSRPAITRIPSMKQLTDPLIQEVDEYLNTLPRPGRPG